jgi:hypothetical protein
LIKPQIKWKTKQELLIIYIISSTNYNLVE